MNQTQTKLNIPAVIVQLRLGTALDELELDAVYRVMDAHGVVL